MFFPFGLHEGKLKKKWSCCGSSQETVNVCLEPRYACVSAQPLIQGDFKSGYISARTCFLTTCYYPATASATATALAMVVEHTSVKSHESTTTCQSIN